VVFVGGGGGGLSAAEAVVDANTGAAIAIPAATKSAAALADKTAARGKGMISPEFFESGADFPRPPKRIPATCHRNNMLRVS
jgi:hypothetical protein